MKCLIKKIKRKVFMMIIENWYLVRLVKRICRILKINMLMLIINMLMLIIRKYVYINILNL